MTTLNLKQLLIGLSLTTLTLSGCATSAMKPGDVNAVAPVADATKPRAGNVYLLRGFIGVFSTGIDTLGSELNAQGVRANVYQDDQWSTLASKIREKYSASPNREPLILIGHSYGADDVLRIARELDKNHIAVDLLVTLDPVTPPQVSPNVRKCMNLYQSNGMWDNLPWLRGVPIPKADDNKSTLLVNANIRTDRTDLLEPGVDHFNIEKKEKIHGEVIKLVLLTCPPRASTAIVASGAAMKAPLTMTTHAPTTAPVSLGTSAAAPLASSARN